MAERGSRESPGVMKRSHWCVPLGRSPMICSAPTIARTYDLLVRLMVETTKLPPGAVRDTREAQNSGTLLTCSITSEATTASNVAPARSHEPLRNGSMGPRHTCSHDSLSRLCSMPLHGLKGLRCM